MNDTEILRSGDHVDDISLCLVSQELLLNVCEFFILQFISRC